MTESLVAARRDELYGKERNVLAEKLRKTLKKDHVLQSGEYNFDVDTEKTGIWSSTTKKEYTHELAPERGGKLYDDANLQMHSHFRLGNDSGRYLPQHTYQGSVTRDDFEKKVVQKPEIRGGDSTVNWPDMAPRYHKDRAVGVTEYGNTYTSEQMIEPKKPVFPRLNTSILKLPIDISKSSHLRAVNVKLGSDPKQTLESESQYAYDKQNDDNNPGKKDARNIPKLMKDMERSSHVFRGGDYDGAVQSMASTFNVDYSKQSNVPLTSKFPWMKVATQNEQGGAHKSDSSSSQEDSQNVKIPGIIIEAHNTKLTIGDAAQGKAYHTKAHFNFGTDPDKKLESVYVKDFEAGTTQKRKPVTIHKSFPDSGVLQRDEDTWKSTTHSADFCRTTRFASTKTIEERDQQMKNNLGRRFRDSINMTYDKTWHRTDRQRSLSHDDYLGPPNNHKFSGLMTGSKSQYNYLETDGVLATKPESIRKTEVMDTYQPSFLDPESCKERRRFKDEQCSSRVTDNRNAHFILGDAEKDHNTETKLEFSGRSKQDQEIPPAGKTEIVPKFKFVHFKMSDNQEDLKPDPHITSDQESMVARNMHVTRSLPALPVHDASVMMVDYVRPTSKLLTEAQQLMLDQNKKLSNKPMATSHFFHYNTKDGNVFESTTSSDYVKPEMMSGKIYLEAR